MRKILATLLLATSVSACDNLFGPEGVPPDSVVFDRTYFFNTCIAGSTTGGARTSPPCVLTTTATTQTQLDSARVTFNTTHLTTLKMSVSTRTLGCATCAPSAQDITTYSGSWDIIADSIVVVLPAPGVNGTTRLQFFSDIPDRVQPYWFGPDSVMFRTGAQGPIALFRP